MKIEHPNQYGKIDVAKIQDFEKEIGSDLPQDYREFLLDNNGGKPIPASFNFSADDTNTDRVREFFGIHAEEYSSIHEQIDCYKGRIPSNLLPIADDELGNVICIGVKGKQNNKIYFWDHELEGTKKSVTLISNSFTEFVGSLFEWENPDESFVMKIIKKNDLQKVKLLLANGYDIEKLDQYEYKMIELATLHNKIEIVKYLYSQGAELRDSLDIAEQNYEEFKEFKALFDYLKSISK